MDEFVLSYSLHYIELGFNMQRSPLIGNWEFVSTNFIRAGSRPKTIGGKIENSLAKQVDRVVVETAFCNVDSKEDE